MPYAGSIRAAGQEPAAIQRVIEQRLASRAIEPQAVVAVKSQTSSEVSVLGKAIRKRNEYRYTGFKPK